MNSDELPMKSYKIPQRIGPFVQDILNRCWYEGYVDSHADMNGDVTLITRVPDDIYPYVIDRAKMEYLNSYSGEFFYVSKREEGNIFWRYSISKFQDASKKLIGNANSGRGIIDDATYEELCRKIDAGTWPPARKAEEDEETEESEE